MANTKSAIKRIRRITTQTLVNKARRSKYRNAIKKMNLLLEDKNATQANDLCQSVVFAKPEPMH